MSLVPPPPPATFRPTPTPPPPPPAARRAPVAPSRRATPPAGATTTTATKATPRVGRKQHGKRSRAAVAAVSVAATGGLTFWFANDDARTHATLAATSATTSTAAGASSGTTTNGSTGGTSSATASGNGTSSATVPGTAATGAVASTTTGLHDGTYDGAVEPNRWGNVQVEITVSAGTISDVAVLQYPNGDGKSMSINARALPQLKAEALAAQSANIATVSGATYTSDGYMASLQSAIDAARA